MERNSPRRAVLALLAAGALLVAGLGDPATGRAAAGEPVEARLPLVRSGFAYGIGSHVAVLIGFVNAQGSSTTAFFEVGLTKSYGQQAPIGEPEQFYAGFHRSEVEEAVLDLRPGRTYHFRLVATNSAGTSYGKDETFKTRPRRPPSPTSPPG
jgi:hypothetical protein